MSRKPGTSGKHAGGTKHHGGKRAGRGRGSGSGAGGPAKHNPQHQPNPAPPGSAKHGPIGAGGGAIGTGGPAPVTQHHHQAQHHNTGASLVMGDVRCCSAQALAASLKYTGCPVMDEQIMDLYFHTTRDPELGCDMKDLLEAASVFGLAGVKPVAWARIPFAEVLPGDIQVWQHLYGEKHAVTMTEHGLYSWGEHWTPENWGTIWPGTLIENWTIRWPR